MKKSKFCFILLLLACLSMGATAEESEYFPKTGELKLIQIKVKNGENSEFYNATLKKKEDSESDILSFEVAPNTLQQTIPPSEKCPKENTVYFNDLKNGDSLRRVQAIFECNGTLQGNPVVDGDFRKTTYKWEFTGGAPIELKFENDKLVL